MMETSELVNRNNNIINVKEKEARTIMNEKIKNYEQNSDNVPEGTDDSTAEEDTSQIQDCVEQDQDAAEAGKNPTSQQAHSSNLSQAEQNTNPSSSKPKSWKVRGVEFAPVIIPLERRLETFSVFVWLCLVVVLGTFASLVLLYGLVYTSYWWAVLAYVTWIIVDRDSCETGGRKGFLRGYIRNLSLWKYYCQYFPIRLIKTVDLDPAQNYIFGSHPHGLLASGCFGGLGTNGANADLIFKEFQIHLHTLAMNFWFPATRELILSLGMQSASKKSITNSISKKEGGNISVIVVGGAAESMYTSTDQISIVLEKRKGFVKLALQHGAQLVPTFSFGEAHIYNILPQPEGSLIRNLQEKVRHVVGFAPVLFFGRGMFQYNFGLLPFRRPVYVVVGQPIPVQKNPNPTAEEIGRVHSQYIEGMKDLYDEYNKVYGNVNIKLNII